MKIQTKQFHNHLTQILEVWVLLAVVILLIVWALPHTIAARNISLFTGVAAGLVWIYVEKPVIHWRACLPTIFLLCVPLWILFHYQFISTLKVEQWDEIDSTWLRTSFSLILGFCAGLIIRKHPYYFLIFIVGIIALPSITTGLYFFQVDLQNKWILNSFVGMFKGKFSGVYFVLCQILVGFGCLSVSFFSSNCSKLQMLGMFMLGCLLILSGIIDGFAFRALNLFLVTFLCVLILTFLVLIVSIYQFVKKRTRLLPIMFSCVILSILLAAFYGFYLYDKQYEKKLTNLIGDIQVATQLEKNQTWVRDGRSIPEPVDENGRLINGSMSVPHGLSAEPSLLPKIRGAMALRIGHLVITCAILIRAPKHR